MILCDTCINAKTDHSNCGGCGVKCGDDETCQEGKCVAPGDPTPTPEPPTCIKQTEICDGLDNDCDGKADEGDDDKSLSRSCGFDGTTPQGECERGTQTCSGGVWGECVGATLPATETCDGKDNDCDGQKDNGVKNACGLCGATPVEFCGDGKGNGLDDNCNGVIDENCTCTPGGQPQACGQELAGHGQCKAGTHACLAGGVWGPCENGFVGPTAETCDGKDNDCDDDLDNEFNVGVVCGAGVGECVATGIFVCKPDKSGTECSAQPKLPATESCDGKDNDCDGVKDDGQLCTDGQSCTAGTCVCPTGTTLCGANCRALQEDEANCGGCNIACTSGDICTSGKCGTPPLCESGTVRVKYTAPTGKSGLIEVRDPGQLGTMYCASATKMNSFECVFTPPPPSGASVYVQFDVDTNSDGIMDYNTGDLWGCNFWENKGRIDGTIQAWKCNASLEVPATVTAVSIYGGGNCEIK
ncbi:MAG: MopE-related protein [Patescibacteria group bacterium]